MPAAPTAPSNPTAPPSVLSQIFTPILRYTHWLHTCWPAGTVERLPKIHDDGTTTLAGVYIVGDLTGIPLLKFSSDSGARAVDRILAEKSFIAARTKSAGASSAPPPPSHSLHPSALDLAIIGAGVAGVAAAMQARKAGLRFEIFEATQVFSTVVNFPRAKPIYTYPTEMTPAGDLQFTANVKETLLDEMERQRKAANIEVTFAHIDHLARSGGELQLIGDDGKVIATALRVIVAIGRSGNFRKLDCPGEELDKVFNRLHDPHDFTGRDILVVGGGDSALETAIALTQAGARVTLSYRKAEFARPKPANVEMIERLLRDPSARVQVENPSSDRVNPAVTTAMAGHASSSPSPGTPGEGRGEGSRDPDPGWTGHAHASEPSPQPSPGVPGEGENARKPVAGGSLHLALSTTLHEIRPADVVLKHVDRTDQTLPNDIVFTMIGREAPLDFFRRSAIRLRGESRARTYAAFVAFIVFCTFLYAWKAGIIAPAWLSPERFWNAWAPRISASLARPANLLGTLRISMSGPAFYYTLAYCSCVVIFGIARIRRRHTPYITAQTLSLIAFQCLPLFLLPEVILPWMGHNGYLGQRVQITGLDGEQLRDARTIVRAHPGRDLATAQTRLFELSILPAQLHAWGDYHLEADGSGNVNAQDAAGKRHLLIDLSAGRRYLIDDTAKTSWLADQLFPPAMYGNGREYWRAYGFILAFPLNIYNVFTDHPLYLWLAICFFQTFVIIPAIVFLWGKGAYCGWICSCGALAETLGDTHRTKMPHGPFWNRLNMLGQAILLFALVLLVLRIVSWAAPDGSWIRNQAQSLFKLGESGDTSSAWARPVAFFFSYHVFVDLFLAGVIGLGCYFWFSGRVWCRFACPLAALMHIYARFSRYRIFADKKKCISCNVCTSVCHQGIDVMNFANKGLPMADVECVRCSACVQSCPTGVLSLGRLTVNGKPVLDRLGASPVRMREE